MHCRPFVCRSARGFALPLALASVLAVGCQEFQRPAFNRGEGANDSPLIVVSFREPKRYLGYGESERGKRVADLIKYWARENAVSPAILEGEDVEHVLTRVRDWTAEDLRSEDWKRLTTGLGARYVLAGEIDPPRLRQRRVVGFYDAQVEAKFRVIDVVSGRVAYEGVAVGEYGSGDLSLDLITDTPDYENDPRVEDRLLRSLAERIGKDLYGYYAD